MGPVLATEVYAQVSAMNFGVYALKADGALHAWGKSYSYSVAGGGSVDMAQYPDGVSWSQLASGSAGVDAHFCSFQADKKPNWWVPNTYAGQVGRRSTSGVSTAYLHPALREAVVATAIPPPPSTPSPTTAASSSAAPSAAGLRGLVTNGVVVALLSIFSTQYQLCGM
ncbi:unnamed protein product [Amoebophrya sp. A25]|nr:unnamed protein product [Amoebophrya sp. A25]|eukprot:GSA25T00013817001.1